MAQTISSSDRIRELSEINGEIPALLSSAGHAIQALSGRQDSANGSKDGDVDMLEDGESLRPVDKSKEAFTKHTTAYFTHIQGVMARLRRQIYALEEAGIVAADAPTLSSGGGGESVPRPVGGQGAGVRRAAPAPPSNRPVAEEGDRITNGGLGNLDVGYLNSRGNRVGVEKEAELVAEAKEMLERLTQDKG